MRYFVLHITLSLLLVIPMTMGTKRSYAQKKTSSITGNIRNYANQPLYLYQCYGDTLLFIDSVKTDNKGKFAVSFSNPNSDIGLYRFNLPRNQWFYIINANEPVEIKTIYKPDIFYNIATDSLTVLRSEENKKFYEFQRLQQKINIANHWLLQMMRLYPLPDPFHKQIEDEYFKRYNAMDEFMKELLLHCSSPVDRQEYPKSHKPQSEYVSLVAGAYYTPNPDWKQPDPRRDSIIAAHYFDYFNPADSFYLNTNILPEKIDNYFNLFSFLMRVNRETRSDYEKHIIKAADDFLKHTVSNAAVHEFCLQYILKKSDSEKMYDALFSVYDKWVYQTKTGDCEQTNPALNKWREKVSVLRNIQTGSIAPDFEMTPLSFAEGLGVRLHQLPANYTLLVFWATRCPHCVEEVSKIRDVVNDFNSKHSPSLREGRDGLMVVAVSLDTDREQWQKFVTEQNLLSFLNYSELKGWQSEVVKKFNVYATPTMFLLDKYKKIIAKPENAEQLSDALMTNTK